MVEEEKKSEEAARAGMTRRDFIVASLAAATGLVVGGSLGREVFPKVVETPGPAVTMTTTTTKTEQTTKTTTQTVTAGKPPLFTNVKTVDRPTYEDGIVRIVGPVERFDQKNDVFCRSKWDNEYVAKLQAIPSIARSETEALEGAAFVAGSIFVDAKAGSNNPKYGGYFGHHLPGIGGLYSWEEPISEKKLPVPDPEEMSNHIKEVAKFYGADLVGICEVDQRWVYSNYYDRYTDASGPIALPYKYAVVMAVEMRWEGIKKSPGYEASAATACGYSKMSEVASSLARYIRSLGYPAVPSGNDTAQSIPLAIDAGLGELGRNGLLITPQFGPRQRLCKVFTDLPLKPDKPIDFGVSRYCYDLCPKNCAMACPAQAISYGDEPDPTPKSISNRTNIARWIVDVEKCYLFWRKNGHDCCNCVANCPYNVYDKNGNLLTR